MLVSFSPLGVGMVGLVLTPLSYRSIGLAAPLLVIAWRLLQGFSVGGEVGPSLACLAKAATPGPPTAWEPRTDSRICASSACHEQPAHMMAG